MSQSIEMAPLSGAQQAHTARDREPSKGNQVLPDINETDIKSEKS